MVKSVFVSRSCFDWNCELIKEGMKFFWRFIFNDLKWNLVGPILRERLKDPDEETGKERDEISVAMAFNEKVSSILLFTSLAFIMGLIIMNIVYDKKIFGVFFDAEADVFSLKSGQKFRR